MTWRDQAACVGHPTATFFPDRADSDVSEALAICSGCLVRTDCLQYALDNGEPGIYGGTTVRQRRKMQRGATRRPRINVRRKAAS